MFCPSQVVVGIVSGVLLFGDQVTVWGIVGAVLIFGGISTTVTGRIGLKQRQPV